MTLNSLFHVACKEMDSKKHCSCGPKLMIVNRLLRSPLKVKSVDLCLGSLGFLLNKVPAKICNLNMDVLLSGLYRKTLNSSRFVFFTFMLTMASILLAMASITPTQWSLGFIQKQCVAFPASEKKRE